MGDKKKAKQLQVAIATHDYDADRNDELSFKAGEHIQVLDELDDGWCQGIKFSDKKLGMFPHNHVELVQDVQPKFLYCKALQSQTAAVPDELPYDENDLIEGIRPSSRSGYMKGTLLSNQERGYFAIMNVQFLSKEEADAEMAHQKKAIRENVHAETKPIPEPLAISTVKEPSVIEDNTESSNDESLLYPSGYIPGSEDEEETANFAPVITPTLKYNIVEAQLRIISCFRDLRIPEEIEVNYPLVQNTYEKKFGIPLDKDEVNELFGSGRTTKALSRGLEEFMDIIEAKDTKENVIKLRLKNGAVRRIKTMEEAYMNGGQSP